MEPPPWRSAPSPRLVQQPPPPRRTPYLAVPQQVLALTVLAAEVPGAAVQLLGDSTLAGLGAVSTSDTAQPQLLREVLFVQQHTAWEEGKREESRDTEIATAPTHGETRPFQGGPSKSSNSLWGLKPSDGRMEGWTEGRGQRPAPHRPQGKPSSLPCQPLGCEVQGLLPLPHLLTFAAEALLHPAESELLVQELLLPAVLTLGHHSPEPLEVLTAVPAAELEHLVLRWGHRAGGQSCGFQMYPEPSGGGPSGGGFLSGWYSRTLVGVGGLTCQSKTSGLPLKRLWQ